LKKIILGFLVVAALSLINAGAALAAPHSPAGEGLSVFAEYDTDWYDSVVVGVGYGFSENLTVGGLYAVDLEDFGIYANLSAGQFRVNAEVGFWEPIDEYYGRVTALYAFDLDPLALGVGGGVDFYDFGDSALFVEAMAEYKMDSITIYGSYMYFPDGGWDSFDVGVNFAF